MPELPEVETIRRGIAPFATGQRVVQMIVRDRRLRWPVPAGLEDRIAGRRIDAVDRRSKYLLFALGADTLLIHLGMSGRLYVLPEPAALKKHDHVDINLESGAIIRFHDPRRFGSVLWWAAGDPPPGQLAGLGPEPFDPMFDAAYLHAITRRRRAAIKLLIMDARVVVGVGNIYASESLFRAGIRPGAAAGRITRPQCERLVACIRAVLAEAIDAGGTTLRDFAGADGNPGYFAQDLHVYGREGRPCRRCGTAIRRRVIGQRSTFYCTACQR